MIENIRQYRERAEITQKEMADRLGVKQSAVSMWDTGAALPRADMLPKIAKLLGCTISDLFEERKETNT